MQKINKSLDQGVTLTLYHNVQFKLLVCFFTEVLKLSFIPALLKCWGTETKQEFSHFAELNWHPKLLFFFHSLKLRSQPFNKMKLIRKRFGTKAGNVWGVEVVVTVNYKACQELLWFPWPCKVIPGRDLRGICLIVAAPPEYRLAYTVWMPLSLVTSWINAGSPRE